MGADFLHRLGKISAQELAPRRRGSSRSRDRLEAVSPLSNQEETVQFQLLTPIAPRGF
jgi:hypothetical protein